MKIVYSMNEYRYYLDRTKTMFCNYNKNILSALRLRKHIKPNIP